LGLSSSPSRRLYEPEAHPIDQVTHLDHRYYDPLRLPTALLRFLRSSLSSPNTLLLPFLCVSHSWGLGRMAEATFLPPGVYPLGIGSPTPYLSQGDNWLSSPRRRLHEPEARFLGYPFVYMPCSQTPVVSCTHRHGVYKTAAFHQLHNVGFPHGFPKVIQ